MNRTADHLAKLATDHALRCEAPDSGERSRHLQLAYYFMKQSDSRRHWTNQAKQSLVWLINHQMKGE